MPVFSGMSPGKAKAASKEPHDLSSPEPGEKGQSRKGVLQNSAASSMPSPAVSGQIDDPSHVEALAESASGADAPLQTGKGEGKGKEREGHRSHPYAGEAEAERTAAKEGDFEVDMVLPGMVPPPGFEPSLFNLGKSELASARSMGQFADGRY